MTPEPDTIAPEQPLYRALDTMHQRGYRHLPVVEADRVIGMVSMRDMPLNYRMLRSRWSQEKTDIIRSIGTLIVDRTVHTVTPETTVWQAAILMADNRIGSLPVMQHDKLVGIFTERDMVRNCWKIPDHITTAHVNE
jgi:acetoin utilization protein AcuB